MTIELLSSQAKMPTRATKGDAGLDVYAPIDFTIHGQCHEKIGLGWRCQFPEGWVLLVFNKSGHAVNKGLDKGAEVIDAGYRGEVHIHLFNHGTDTVRFRAGDKIAQLLLMPVWAGMPVEGPIDLDTERGSGRMGSTGLR